MTQEASHQQRLAGIQERLRELAGQRVHISKGGVSHFVPLPGDRRRQGQAIDISGLNRILSLDPLARICVAEPGLSFAELLQATLPHGLMPAVVPELEGITLGGAIAGCSIESSSYRYGTFHDTCLDYELLTSSGERIVCSREQDPLLFHMMHGSYGTLGILTRLSFRLIPARPFVRLSYHRYGSLLEFKQALLQQCRADAYPFIDGIVHGPREAILCLGQFLDDAPYVSDYRHEKIYYKSTRERLDDYLTTYDYCFRYDTECHWLSRSIPLLENPLLRRLAGGVMLGSGNLIRWSGRLEKLIGLKKRPDVIVDVFIPERRLSEFLDWYEQAFDYYPLWVVPGRLLNPYPWLSERKRAEMGEGLIIDCAVYGKPNRDPAVDYSELLEAKTEACGGIKTLISRNHYSRERFWSIFNPSNYAAIKQRTDPQGKLAELYSKFHPEAEPAVRVELPHRQAQAEPLVEREIA